MKLLRPILSLTLAFLVLMASSNFVVGIHWCMGHVQDVALFAKATPCGMEKKTPPCHRQFSKRCCEDETIVHQGQDFKYAPSQFKIVAPVVDIIQPPVVIAEIVPVSPLSKIDHYNYDPPLRSIDRTIDLQVFII